jgi:hypothetical protein
LEPIERTYLTPVKEEEKMAPKFLCKRSLGALSVSLAVSLAGAAAARAEMPGLTLHALGTNEVFTPVAIARVTEGPTASSEVHVTEQRQWFGLNLDVRLFPLFSLDLGASQGRLQEVRIDSSQGNSVFTTGNAPLRHLTLSALFHPIPAGAGRRVDLYFGPTVGMAYYTRVFAGSESKSAYGGKLGFDVRLGDSHWLVTGEGSFLRSDIQVLAGTQSQTLDYRVFAAGLGYHW